MLRMIVILLYVYTSERRDSTVEATPLQVHMLGSFSLRLGGAEINDGDNRSKKVWLLLAYMIYTRNRLSSPSELFQLLWNGEEKSSNPLNALKTMFHRVRTCLDPLGEGVGHKLILRKEGTYVWNNDIPIQLDIDQFETLCRSGSKARTDEKRLEHWLKAVPLYQGDFVAKLGSEPWVVPIAAYYRNLYVDTVLSILPLLESQGRWQESVQLCRTAISHEPYQEQFYRFLMTALIQLGEQRQAVTVYDDMSQLLLGHLGVMPSNDVLTLYREALRTINDHTVAPGIILEQLRETSTDGGAFFCDYDVFKCIYHSVARSVTRSGDAAHLALISIVGEDGKDLARRSLDRVVVNLQELIRTSLRRGDVAARCSVSQFILLLPQANYENSQMICTRIIRSFNRQYPHSPAQLTSSVHPLEPNP